MTFAVDFDVANDWGSGFTANLSIANNSSSDVNSWTLEFEAPFEITNIWGAEIVSQDGNRYTVRNLSYNGTLTADGTVSFGFNGSGESVEPTGYSLNGESIGTSPSIPTLSVDNVTVTEGDSGTVAAEFVVNLSEASDQEVMVEYGTANGTATAGSDYTAQSGTLTFAAGETSKIISVPVLGDTTVENNETFTLNLSSPSNATIADAQGIGTITDNDESAPVLPQLSIDDVSVTEGDSGSKNATFTVNLSAASTESVTVDYGTSDDTATAGSDYTAQSGTITFDAGETSQTITVPILGDTTVESDETFNVNLSQANNATIADAQGVGTISNDDSSSLPTTDNAFAVDFDVANDWGSGFTANLEIANNSSSQVNGWTLEFDSQFEITDIWGAKILSKEGNRYTIGNLSYNGTLAADGTVSFGFNGNGDSVEPTSYSLNGDPIDASPSIPTLSVDDVSVTEGDNGTVAAEFVVNMSEASDQEVTVEYGTDNGTATAGSDYTAQSGTITFAAGETSKIISVDVNGDTTVESNETFNLNLSNASNATIADAQGVGTINNDDADSTPVLPQFSINDVSVTEGDSGSKNATFTVSLSAASTESISVDYGTSNDTATAGSDYTAESGTLTFAAGETSKTISVAVTGDTTVESDETFNVNLSNASNATIGDGQGVGTILNNDSSQPPPQQGDFNYGEALQKSILFYYAQRSGDLPDTNPIPWRGDSALNDGSDVGVDLTGGYYDAGDHVKFGLPGAASLTMLGWGAVQYQDAYQQSGQFEEVLDTIKWGTDYILKAHVTDGQGTKEFYGQVGDGNLDHAYWGPPEDMTMERPAYKIDRQNPGSDLAGEAAASLAAASIVFRGVDEAYADTLLQNAEQLYDFADQYRGVYTDAIPDAGQFYNSFSGFQDELVWGATWLHKATEAAGSTDTTYLNKAESLYQGIGPGWTQSWDDKSYGAAILLAQETGKSEYKGDVEGWLNSWLPGGSTATYTDGGLAWLSQWGSLRYSANTSFLAGVYADTVNDPNGQYSDFAEGQIDYILGDNPRDFSYMVGFGEDYALNPHHRAASGVTNISDSRDNLHTLYGALVGGPASADDFDYVDERTDFIRNEVAMDYNAGLTGALARMYGEFGGQTLDTISGVNLDNLNSLTVADVVAS
ncbi:MAG: glycoside hydrolase family 9 protein [Coleofasciculus sp. B1-GNL1-01]|uniref:glycoside hydrolase family 9 protein n=1 Tax=Coleofasciculus sp. B1-GNL1-01 TaxID=3068484 RepID=UPI0033046BFC